MIEDSMTNGLKVCPRCLAGIQSREGVLAVKEVVTDEENLICDWCGEESDTLYEIIPDKT